MSPATPTNAAAMRAMREWRRSLTKDQRWCILITADPDALASALALKRIMQTRVRSVDIARTNEVSRPDNLAMIRYLRIPARQWQPEKAASYTHFAIVDSQPSHNPAYFDIRFDVIIDHHPPKPLPQEAAPCGKAAENGGAPEADAAPAEAAPPHVPALVDIRRREKRAYPVEDMEEQGYEADFSRVETEQMLEALPPNLRQAVRMRHFEGMSSVEIGWALDVPAATVRTRLRAAAILLKKQWKDGETI